MRWSYVCAQKKKIDLKLTVDMSNDINDMPFEVDWCFSSGRFNFKN